MVKRASVVLLSVLAACNGGEEAAEPAARAPEAAAAGSEPTEEGVGGGPAGWVREAPSSSMRVAQFRLPGEGGSEDAELVVYAFPGGAGTVEANLERWIAQFEQPDGGSSREAAEITRERVGDLSLHRIDLGGTYVAETSPGSGVRVREEGWSLIGAIVEGHAGTRFVKCVGPAETVARWEESVGAYLRTVRP